MSRKFYSSMLFALAILASSTVHAVPNLAWSQRYYSDASLTVEVGGRYIDCEGNLHKWGVTSAYRGPKVVEEICPEMAY